MASYEKRGKSIRAIVRLPGGGKETATFDTRHEAEAWAKNLEKKKAEGVDLGTVGKTNRDLFLTYLEQVASKTDSAGPNENRIYKWLEDPISNLRVSSTTSHDINEWIQRSLTVPSKRTGRMVVGSSVNRELNLMSGAFTYGIKSLRWLKINPVLGCLRPEKGRSRNRPLLTTEEIADLIVATGMSADPEWSTVGARTCAAFLLALETGMRSGELLRIRPQDYQRKLNFVHVAAVERRGRKSAMSGRTNIDPSRRVPLTAKAIEILDKLLATMPKNQAAVPAMGFGLPPYLFGISDQQRSGQWNKALKRTGIADLHFHDTKHEAATRLSKYIDVLALSHAIGTKDIRLLRDTYYNNDATRIAALLPAQLSTGHISTALNSGRQQP